MRDEHQFDVIVIGAGPIGAATARHLAAQDAAILVVGPEEPARFEDHEGVWAGYYDQGRLAHVLEVPLITSLLATRSRRRFPALSERTGIDFTTPVRSLTVMPDSGHGSGNAGWFDREGLARNAADLNVEVSRLDEVELRREYPQLRFEPGHVGLEQRDALIVNPRELVRAELTVATADGATLVRDEVISIENIGDGVRVTARSGLSWRARSVMLATGAASNATGLLPRPLAMSTFGATVVLVEVPDPAAVQIPAMMYLKMRADTLLFGGIVMSPLRYPDGRWYLKCAGRSLMDYPLDSAADIAQWARTGGCQDDIGEALDVLADLLPGYELGPAHTRPCLVSSTPTDRPYIDHVDEHTVIAVEGERGVMAADEIGRLAAELTTAGRWRDSIPHEVFHAGWAEPTPVAPTLSAPTPTQRA